MIRSQNAYLANDFDDPTRRASLSWYRERTYTNATFFVTSLANKTETGALREHALRLSSEINSENITRSEFPLTCTSRRPIYTEINASGIVLRVCVPGDFGTHPSSRTRNKENIKEDL